MRSEDHLEIAEMEKIPLSMVFVGFRLCRVSSPVAIGKARDFDDSQDHNTSLAPTKSWFCFG